jgi:hypothetical protein
VTTATLSFLASGLAGCGDDAGSPDAATADSGVLVVLDSGLQSAPRDAGVSTSDAGASTSDASTVMGSTVPATFATVKLVLGGGGGIMPCFAAPCHGVNGMAPPDHPLELPQSNDAQLFTNLTSYVSKACNNTKLVTPGNPAQSALVTILKGACGATPRMPYGCSEQAGDCIPADYIAALSKWIADGAKR